jgi:hypothetical protein
MPRRGKLKVIKAERRLVGDRECEVVTIALQDERRGTKWIGCSLEFFQNVARTTKGKVALMLALTIYRRCQVCKSQTNTLPPDELAALAITRDNSHKALRKLEAAGLVQLHPIVPGHKTVITLLWPR